MGEIHESPLNRYSFAERHRFVWFETGPTTAISINRALARRLFPIPEEGVRISGDDFIVCGASLIGEVYSIGKKLGGYRIHGNNNWHRSAAKKISGIHRDAAELPQPEARRERQVTGYFVQ